MRKRIFVLILLLACGLLFWLLFPQQPAKEEAKEEKVASSVTSEPSAPDAAAGPGPSVSKEPIQPSGDISPSGGDTPASPALAKADAGPPTADAPGRETPAGDESASPLVIDLEALTGGKSGKLSALMAERKKRWGLDKSVDVVATGDEKVKVGSFMLSLDEIQKILQIAEGRVIVEDIRDAESSVRKTLTYFGVRVVRPGDNLWDIHFGILREYLASKGMKVSPQADRPSPHGRSSGVGRVLKFAENMVMVYNLETGAPPRDINILQPGAEVVIFNFTPIFKLLAGIDFASLDRIRFDGRTLFLEPMG